jgi:hypothetical protein
MVRSGVRFSEAAEEWLRLIREDGERKPSTLVDYQLAFRTHLLPGTHRCALLHSRVEAKAIELILAALTAGNECEPHSLPGAANGRLKAQWI